MAKNGELRKNPLYLQCIDKMSAETDTNCWFNLCYELFHCCEYQKAQGVSFDPASGACLSVVWESDGTPCSHIEFCIPGMSSDCISTNMYNELMKLIFVNAPSDRKYQTPLLIKTNKGFLSLEKRRVAIGFGGGVTDYADGLIVNLLHLI